ncbi:hypothetical protein EDF22_0656 [Rathayibacter sp. PhB127]|uniref:hypothetical protein n=1 Tax=Rathayibacter sp. PhB127 TaxID=2485176 RepID=UPI000FC1317C|nr:hypothetical protein [Rathayibacter sp. PhB127]ROS28924.1 hypothetical protein EDF22_0656 [Rathayibacter sp. PhB127]
MSRYLLVGTNGERWDLGGDQVHIDGSSFEGLLGDPEWEEQTQQSAGLDGQRFVGTRAQPRQGSFVAKIGWDRPAEFRSIDRRWWKSWEPSKYATLEVATEGRGSRYLDLRFRSDGRWSVDADPDLFKRARVPMDVVADDPFWRGDKLSFDFNPNKAPVDFYGRDRGQAGGPRFYRSRSIVRNAQNLFNPGDVPSPVTWTLTGPFESFELTVAGQTVALDRAVPDGQQVTVDSRNYSVVLWTGAESVDLTREASWGFASLPAGSAVPVSVLVYGTGRVKAEWTPKYRRAA